MTKSHSKLLLASLLDGDQSRMKGNWMKENDSRVRYRITKRPFDPNLGSSLTLLHYRSISRNYRHIAVGTTFGGISLICKLDLHILFAVIRDEDGN
ncbi:hypothetical protein CEXT_390551 [Caerostris extrusa]|uniref:Uncharacterized protein n=1 Tax=Caerostris extrusa TaxID=172846 RepID=A0AAV4YC28_CAEEX|nr:hypothetical protein CEXT_390551 [Caerostris extrusa]